MKLVLMISAAMLLGATGAMAQTMSKDEMIAQAVKAAPEGLRADATVVSYDAKGDPMVLREGKNGIVCTPNRQTDSYSVNCTMTSAKRARCRVSGSMLCIPVRSISRPKCSSKASTVGKSSAISR